MSATPSDSSAKVSSNEVEVQAFWEPWQEGRLNALRSIPIDGEQFKNLKPAEALRTYSHQQFSVFLPPGPAEVGDTWNVDQASVRDFLSQLHLDVRDNPNIDGNGTVAILRASTDQFWEVSFRTHSQFYFPQEIYLSPSQFRGKLVIDRQSKNVSYFALSVPTERSRNLGFERYKEPFMVGVGYVPRLELVTNLPIPNIAWTREISQAVAEERLAQKILPCESISWLPIDAALTQSRVQKKPLLAIVIEGALTDQSC